MKNLVVIAPLIFLALGFKACEKVVFPPSGDVYETFSASVQPIFNSDCISCHDGGRDPNLTEGNSYNALKNGGFIDTANPESSVLYEKLTSTHASRTSENNKKIILDWIKDGAPNN